MSETTETIQAAAPLPSRTDIEKFRDGETVVRTDTRGRKLEIKQLSLLEEMGLLAVAGPRADNRRWMMYATWAHCVRGIDGLPFVLPVTENQLKAHISRVDSAGVAAVALLLSEGVSAASDDDEEGSVEVSTADAAKN